MKIIWEDMDIRVGVVVGNPNRSERWMIGYAQLDGKKFHTLNSLEDGMVREYATMADLVSALNRAEEIPAIILDHPRFEHKRWPKTAIEVN